MNINTRDTIRSCTSCQMCSAVCPKNAIVIELDSHGFYRPNIKNDICIDCGLCTQVCYKYDTTINLTSPDELSVISLYAASAKDDDIVYQTTSGGIADILAKELIEEGYNVLGVVYDYEKDRAVSRIVTSKQDTDGFRGSKYIQSFTAVAFKELVLNCENQKFAVFGLPCHIYAINKYLSKHNLRDNCILIDLYCHGCPSMLVWDKTKAKIKKKLNAERFDYVNFRSKSKGWGQFVLEARSGKKKYKSTPLHNEFYDMFFSNQVLNESCTDCQLRSTLAYTDIRLGDFWGEAFRRTSRGMSGVSVVTKRGHEIIVKIADSISTQKLSHDVFIPYQSWGHKYNINSPLRNTLLNMLQGEKSIGDISNVLNRKLSIRQRVKRLLKLIYFFSFK